jgi:hypothetical protein
MVVKELLCPQRIRKITASFAFIEHRFLQNGYWSRLSHHELLLYLFLVLVRRPLGDVLLLQLRPDPKPAQALGG